MGDLSPHFNRSEFRCKCGCGGDSIDYGTLQLLENIRGHFGVPLVINSAFRCVNHNRAVGGASSSQHLFGRAADIRLNGITPTVVANYVENGPLNGKGGVGRYNSFTHVDTRTKGPARWRG